MTMESPSSSDQTKIRKLVPWLIGVGALAVYLWTLNPWISFSNLLQVARISGWVWQEELSGPLYWLLTYPLRWLPARFIPLGINFFSALCAVLSLMLLARSVMLLPHDRTHEQRQKEKSDFSLLTIRFAWVAPVMAALVCGLQLSFWDNATSAVADWPVASSNEMLDLLLFAYVIRCVLESRLDEVSPWLTKASFVYGLAITNNWAMIAYLPLFLIALVWIKGLSFFNPQFLARMFLWGCAGLLLYLLLPLVQSVADISKVPFWKGLKTNLQFQQYALATLPFSKALIFGDGQMWVLGLGSLLPILMLSIRWPSYFGDPSRLGVAITTFILQVAHAALFLFCIWIALDSPLSPKHKLGLPSLTLYYLGALSIGYFVGYFLLVFGASGEKSRRTPGFVRLMNGVIQAAVWLLLLLVPVLLVARNLPQIKQGRLFMGQYASAMAENIPKTKTVLLSDNPRQLFIVRAFLTRNGSASDYVFVDTGGLEKADYHRFLLKQYGSRWPVDLRTQDFDSQSLIGILERLSDSKNELYYLHPSFGAFFEAYYPEPHGLVYKLNSFPTNTLLAPPMPETIRVENNKFWAKLREQSLEPLAELTTPGAQEKAPHLLWAITNRLHLVIEPNLETTSLGPLYAHALVWWGDELQKMVSWGEQLEKREFLTNAAAAFELAIRLDPENVVAPINLECNRALLKGIKIPPADPKTLEDKFGKYRKWADLMNANGPFDDPSFCYEQGRVFAGGRLLRQAAHQFARIKSLAPENLRARLWLAQIYLLGKMPDETLKITQECHAQADLLKMNKTNRVELLSIETSARLAKHDVRGAEEGVQAALKAYPESEELLLGTASRVFISHMQYTNALKYIDQQLRASPNLAAALRTKGVAYLQIGEKAIKENKEVEAKEAFENAVEPFTRALATETNTTAHTPDYYTARLNRAIAYLRSGRLDEAKRDYETLQKVAPRMYQIFYGLAEIARQKNEKEAAIRNYQSYLASQPENPAEIQEVQNRLKELKSGSP